MQQNVDGLTGQGAIVLNHEVEAGCFKWQNIPESCVHNISSAYILWPQCGHMTILAARNYGHELT